MQNKEIWLLIDTSMGGCSVGLYEDSKVIAELYDDTLYGHTQKLVPLIHDIFKANHLEFNDISGIACTVGPGSFTGIRVGLSTANGIALSLNKKIAGVPTLAALYFSSPQQLSNAICVIDSQRKDYFVQEWNETPRGDVRICQEEDILKLALENDQRIVGNFNLSSQNHILADKIHFFSAPSLLGIGLCIDHNFLTEPYPFYARAPEIK